MLPRRRPRPARLHLAEVERRLTALGPERARGLLIETSGTETCANTRAFYLARSHRQETTVSDHYGPGDDEVSYWRFLDR